MTVFDKWSKDINQREICAYATQDGHKSDDYQAGFRQGGGVSIAALAAASRLEESGEFSATQYLECAEKGYWHLREKNRQYLNDGVENIIDEYCALLATVELFKATSKHEFLTEARDWSNKLQQRQQSDANFSHFWSANSDGSRPYFHAAEAGLPIIALCSYLEIETDAALIESATSAIEQSVQFELEITTHTANPFGYPRQYVKPIDGDKLGAMLSKWIS